MASSLARQLAQGVSLNASRLLEKSRRKSTESYLFTGHEADQHDLDIVFSLASNALLRLKTIEPALASLEDPLFSDAAKSTDRTLLSGDAYQVLDENLKSCLRLLGPYLMDAPTGKILEWLVRRFR
jgi:U3 small nucleolar RNA-associated protein 10